MKKLKSIICLTLLCSFSAHAQDFKSDARIEQLMDELPTGWTSTRTDSSLRIETIDSIWVMHGNWHNASTDHWESKNDSTWIKTSGRKMKLVFEFKLIDKLSKAEVIALKKENASYTGRWSYEIFNSENHTLLQTIVPPVDNMENALWPPNNGEKEVNQLLYSLFEDM